MDGLSKTEIEIIASFEFEKKFFFTSADIDEFARNKTHRYNIIKNLIKKRRIEKLNRSKYYLIPIKAKSGRWAEDSFIIADEVMDGEDYFIGGWAAANYWRLTDQIPMKTEVYTTKRQGTKKFISTTLIFRRTTRKKLKESVTKIIKGHKFNILNKEATKKWLLKRN